MGEEPLVKTAAHVFQDLCYNYRDSLTAGIIVGGWDKKEGGQVQSCVQSCCFNGRSAVAVFVSFFDWCLIPYSRTFHVHEAGQHWREEH